jgi:hypothetical protein
VTLFWNGVVGVFVWHLAGEWQSNRTPWVASLFLLLFLAVGILIAWAAVTSLLGLFSPRLRLVLTPGAVSLGESAAARMEVNGGSGTFERLRLFLEGREEADYRRGTSSYTTRRGSLRSRSST